MRHRPHSGPALGRVKVEFVLAEAEIVPVIVETEIEKQVGM